MGAHSAFHGFTVPAELRPAPLPTTASLYCIRGTNSLLYQLEQSATRWDGAVALGAIYLGF